MAENNQKNSKLMICGIILALVVIIYLVGFGYLYYQRSAAAEEARVKPMVEKMIGSLKAFHERIGRYPHDFKEVNEQVWHYPRTRYGETGRELTARKYFYLYQLVDNHTCLLWATPVSPDGEGASQPAFFLVVTPKYIKNWRGAAITSSKAGKIKRRQNVIPTLDELEGIGLYEQPLIIKY